MINVILDKADWRRVVKEFYHEADWVNELNLITFICTEATVEPVEISLPPVHAIELALMLGIACQE